MHRNISINTLCLPPASLGNQADAIARLGARAISPTRDEVTDLGAGKAARVLRDAGLMVATLSHMSFGYATSAAAQEARARLDQTLDMAAEIGADCVIMTTGGRGMYDWNSAANSFATEIAPCAEKARALGIALGIEPTSHLYTDASIAHRLSDTVDIARRAGIALMIDIFACWFDSDIDAALAQAAPLSPLAQISDYVHGDRGLPCRAVPGDGVIPFERIVPAMVAGGFRGWWDMEIIGPRIREEGADKALPRAAAHIGGLLEAAGVPAQ
jgi:sugar phosphate isomerase/epimerase